MIVLDASAVVAMLMRAPAADAVESRLFRADEALHAPHLIDLEVMQVLRRQVMTGQMSESRASSALDAWFAMPVERWPHIDLAPRIWTLRATMTAYDAAYVALAETLAATLVTTDSKLAGAPGHRALIEVVRP